MHAADHVPILTELDISVQKSPEKLKMQWMEADWDTFLKVLAENLQPICPLAATKEIDAAVDHLITTIQQSAESTVPVARITPYSHPGYPPELRRLHNIVNHTRRWAASGQEKDIKAFHQAKHMLGRETAKLSRKNRHAHVEDATESMEGFWKLARWARRCGGVQPTYMPTLHAGNQTYDTPERKAQALQETLFPPPPEADLSDIPNYEYPEPLQMPAITEKEVCQAVWRAAPNKAPSPDGILSRARKLADKTNNIHI